VLSRLTEEQRGDCAGPQHLFPVLQPIQSSPHGAALLKPFPLQYLFHCPLFPFPVARSDLGACYGLGDFPDYNSHSVLVGLPPFLPSGAVLNAVFSPPITVIAYEFPFRLGDRALPFAFRAAGGLLGAFNDPFNFDDRL